MSVYPYAGPILVGCVCPSLAGPHRAVFSDSTVCSFPARGILNSKREVISCWGPDVRECQRNAKARVWNGWLEGSA